MVGESMKIVARKFDGVTEHVSSEDSSYMAIARYLGEDFRLSSRTFYPIAMLTCPALGARPVLTTGLASRV